jgi:capsule polysaccharide modification protein KpsS
MLKKIHFNILIPDGIQYRIIGGINNFFFKQLNANPKIKFIREYVSSEKLLHHSQFVATITGTVGWEAISNNKHALIFGNAWYKNFPGVIQYSPTVSLNDILMNHFTHEELENTLKRMYKKMADGIIDRNNCHIIENFNEDINTQLVADAVEKYITFLFTEEKIHEQFI